MRLTSPFLSIVAAAILGILSVAGFAPFSVFPLPLLALAALFLFWTRARSARLALWQGFGFGLGLFGAGVSWIYVSIHDFGGMPLTAAVLAMVAFCSLMALFPALAGWLQARIGKSDGVRLLVAMPAIWGVMEWLRGWLFSGFPWLELGYSQVEWSPLAGFAPLLGVHGVSLLLAVSAGALALAVRRGWRVHAAAVLVVLAVGGLVLGRAAWVEPVGDPVRVSLLQGNIAQDIKWNPEVASGTLKTYATLAAKSQGRLIVMPETALPLFYDEVPPAYFDLLTAFARRRGGDVVLGMPLETRPGAYFNSALSVGVSPSQVYSKFHLVPFGEFLPLRPVFSWVLDILHIPLSDFTRGPEVQKPMAVAGQHLAVDICYEDAFGEEIIRQLPAATMLANLTNDAWFGHSIGPRQHLQMAQMRALESGRYMLRATNTGVTAIIDQRGHVVRQAPMFTTTVLEGSAQGFRGATPYVRLGNAPVLVMMAAMVLFAWRRRS